MIYQNLTDDDIRITYPDDVMINGKKASASPYSTTVGAGASVVEDIRVYSFSYDDVGITEWSEVKDLRMSIEVENSCYKTIDETDLVLDPTETVLPG